MKGSTTVEMAYIMPVVLLAFIAVIYASFFYHDKNIMYGTAYEAAVVGAQKERTIQGLDGGEVSAQFQQQIQGKLIFFSGAQVEVWEEGNYIVAQVSAEKGRMRILAKKKTAAAQPEKFIRLWRKVT